MALLSRAGKVIPSLIRSPSRAGRNIMWGAMGVGAVTTAIAGGTVNGMVTEQPRDTPLVDALFEATIGDPQADRHILGTDVGLSDLYGIPGGHLPGHSLRMINPTTFGDIAMSDAANIRGREYNQFTMDLAQDRVNAQMGRSRSTNRNYNATGDIVFGMYNRRLG